MSAILATSGAIRSLVDGTLRLTVDIEPKDAQAAFALFGKPGSPVALARITNEAAVEHDRQAQAQPPAEPLERKPLSLASKVALRCRERSFQSFLSREKQGAWRQALNTGFVTEDLDESRTNFAADAVRIVCEVKSRSEIVPGSDAAKRWDTLEADYHHWQRTGAAA